MPPLRLSRLGPHSWRVEGEAVAATVDGEGVLRGLWQRGEEAVAVGPLPCLWRAPTDNDEYGGYAETWRRAGLDADTTAREVALHPHAPPHIPPHPLTRHASSYTPSTPPLAGGGVACVAASAAASHRAG